MCQRGDVAPVAVLGIGHRQPAVHREPDAPARIRNHASMPLDALDRQQAVSDGVLADGRVRERRICQPFAVNAEDAIRGGDPQPPAPVFRKPENRAAQHRRDVDRRLQLTCSEDRQPSGGSGPDVAGRILEEHVDIVGRQAVFRGVTPPAAARQRADAVRCREPHRSVRAFDDRGHGVRGQPVRGRVGRERAVLEPARAAAQRAGPHRAVTRLMNRVHAVLSQPVGLRQALRRERCVPVRPQPRQSATLPADPHVVAGAGNRIHHVVAQSRLIDLPDLPVPHPVEPARRRGEPDALCRIDVDRPHAVGRQALRAGVAREHAVAQSLDPSRRADPDVAVAILEQRRNGPAEARVPLLQPHDAAAVDTQQAARPARSRRWIRGPESWRARPACGARPVVRIASPRSPSTARSPCRCLSRDRRSDPEEGS